MVERIVMKAIRSGIVIASFHTNMDNVRGGVNFKIAEKLGLLNTDFIHPQLTDGVENGSTVCGTLPSPMPARSFIKMVKERFHAQTAMTNRLLLRPISRVAICGGAGGSFIGDALSANADAFITGEMHYHEFFDHDDLQIVVIGHYETEQFTSEIFKQIITNHCKDVPAYIAETNTNPIHYL